jgi:hypothetical protein
MTKINITQDPDNGALRLAITSTSTLTAVTRTDANGVADVRTLPGQMPYTAQLVEDARNLCINPSSSTTANYGVNQGGGTAALSIASGMVRCTWTVDATGSGGVNAATTLLPWTYKAGETYSISMNVQMSKDGTVQFGGYYKMGSTNVGGGAVTYTSVTANTTQRLTVALPVAADADSMYFYCYVNTANGGTLAKAGDWIATDAVVAYKGTTYPGYFTGGTANTTDYTYTYTGVANASQSIRWAPTPLLLDDYEAASGTVSYTAADDTEVTTWDIGAPWLFVPVMPAYSVRIQALLDYSAGGQSLGTIHELLGREDPIAVLRGMSSRRGSIKLYCGTFAEAVTVVEATKRGEVLMLRQPEHQGMDMYFTATSYGIPTLETRGAETVFGVDIGYAQLARPIGDLSGSLGWDFTALASAYPSFATVAKKYATFQDLLLNEPI